MEPLKVFTAAEANALLPKLVPLLQELKAKREGILKREVEIDSLELVSKKNEDGFAPALDRELQGYNREVNRFYAVVDAIHELGCFLKDVDLGLVDFYHMHEGHVVYLCWKLGEPEVAYWHEVGRGFSNREPLKQTG